MNENENHAIDSAARLIADSSYVVALVGSGMSVESGIPTFRGPGGLWTRVGEPSMRGYEDFLADPKLWWENQLAGGMGMHIMRRQDVQSTVLFFRSARSLEVT